jgi:hypothetical protein
MRSWLVLSFASGLTVACCSPVAASTAYLNGLKVAEAAASPIEEAVYPYRGPSTVSNDASIAIALAPEAGTV